MADPQAELPTDTATSDDAVEEDAQKTDGQAVELSDEELAKKLAAEWAAEEQQQQQQQAQQGSSSESGSTVDLDAQLAAQLALQEEEEKAAADAAKAQALQQAQSQPVPAADLAYGRKLMEPNKQPPTKACIKRLTFDISSIFRSPDPSIHVMPSDDDITRVDALIIGPEDTPYAGGFFHFQMLFPHDYPWKSPKVLLVTTDSGRVRFNPNLYANGKVCLSILGTWAGPGWTPVQNVMSVLLSIQSLMCKEPFRNEPGFETEGSQKDVQDYNDCIEHETLRVAVLGMMERPTSREAFWCIQEKFFLQHIDDYRKRILANQHKDGTKMRDPFGAHRGLFRFASLLPRLDAIEEALKAGGITQGTMV